MRRENVFWIISLTLLGCRDLPLESGDSQGGPIRAAVAPTLSCTRSWANGVDGNWNDPTMWSPAGIPMSNDTVCIKATGTYTVLLDSISYVPNLQLGASGAVATLRLESTSTTPQLGVIDTHSIKPGSTVVLMDAVLAVGRLTVNEGTLRLSGSVAEYDTLVNSGIIRFDSRSFLEGTHFENNGTIKVNGSAPSHLDGWNSTFDFRSGQVTGSQILKIRDDGTAGMLHWQGGRFEALTTDSTQAVVNVIGMDTIRLELVASGRLTVETT